MSTALRFVDYFRHYIRAKRVAFDTNWDRASGEGTYLFANGLPIGMATPGDCQGIKMEFDYGVTPTLTTGKMAHGLDIKMTMDQDWDTDTKPYNCTVRGARIQAWSEDNISGRLTGAYINARAEGTSKEIEGYISGETGPGIIGIQARTELGTSATITSPAAVGVMIYHHSKGNAVLTGGYRALQIEAPLLLPGASITGTTYAIYIGEDWGGADTFDVTIGAATDHVKINTVTSSKSVRLNSQTYTVDASIVGVQIKPRYGVNLSDNCYGLEVEPGCDTGSTFTGKGITGVASRPRMKGGNLSGDVLAFEAKLEYGDAGKTVALGSAALKCILESNRTFTQGVYPIYVLTGGNTADWTSFALVPNDAVMAHDGSYTCTTESGWLKVNVGTAASNSPMYIQLWDTKGE